MVALAATDFLGSAEAAALQRERRDPRRYAHTRYRCLYNGYLLTVDPARAMSPTGNSDRYRLYVLNAVLIDPSTGRIAATFPALGKPATDGGPVAQPLSAYPALKTSERPTAPGVTIAQLLAYWRQTGVSESLLRTTDWLDLDGAVATPGLADNHFHVSSWSKKLPAPGERFGYYADLSDPAYYVNTSDWSRNCARDAIWRIVADANRHLVDTGDEGIFLHGYIYGEIDSGPDGEAQPAYLYSSSSSCEGADFNPGNLLNRVGARLVTPPEDPCKSDPSAWPPIDYQVLPALLVQTSGQACWYNSALLAKYNEKQEAGAASPVMSLASATNSGTGGGDVWILATQPGDAGADPLFTASVPYSADVVVAKEGMTGTLTVPFDVTSTDPAQRTLTAQAMIPELAASALSGTVSSLQIKRFYRPIVKCIPQTKWDTAAAYWGEPVTSDPVGYGAWDPRAPYATNWYNGAKRGLIQYFYDAAAQAWRPTGYAEHYPMRDALAAVVVKTPTVPDLMEHRRRTAAWCHRHGLTLVNDIMFYRRDGESVEFKACEGLSFDHTLAGDADFYSRIGLDPWVATGDFNLRVGLYYYIETGDDTAETLRLAHSAAGGSDVDRLEPPPEHPEYPGWFRWLGWKLQLDGASVTRNFFTSAPLAKSRRTDPVTVRNELGNQVTFYDHSYGLLTMTDLQEQVFTSRESAALYWLVRESSPTSPFRNPQIVRDWSALGKGVVNMLGASVAAAALEADLAKLTHTVLSATQAAQLAAKIKGVVEQVNDAWERTLEAIIRIWYERSISPAGLPDLPSQVVCHVSGDGATDLWARAIRQLKNDVENLPAEWNRLPQRWKAVVPETANLSTLRRGFSGERFRMEHLVFISSYLLEDLKGVDGVDAKTTPARRNVAVSLQPAIILIDGRSGEGFPPAQELWPMPQSVNPWGGLPAIPRYHVVEALKTFLDHDIPLTLNTDPPAMRDPRPALTVLGAVTRTPVEIDPSHWADQTGDEPALRPPDYLVGKVYAPFGYLAGAAGNPLQLTVEQTLASMTFWGAYAAGMESEVGALAAPLNSEHSGWFADIVVWRVNPLAIQGPGGLTLEALGRMPADSNDAARLATVNAFIRGFLPSLTIVAGVPVYQRAAK
jgi:predicted amidohydrolase YtcJ